MSARTSSYENKRKIQQEENEKAIKQFYRTKADRQIVSFVCWMHEEVLKNNKGFQMERQAVQPMEIYVKEK